MGRPWETISGHARGVTVSDNVFWLTGESAVVIAGEYAAGVVSSATDHFPLRTTVRGNYCYHPGVNNLQSSIFFQALAVQSHVLDNVCFDGPRMGRRTAHRSVREMSPKHMASNKNRLH